MKKIHILAKNPGLALVPSVVLSVSIALDQFCRGPSLTQMVVMRLLA